MNALHTLSAVTSSTMPFCHLPFYHATLPCHSTICRSTMPLYYAILPFAVLPCHSTMPFYHLPFYHAVAYLGFHKGVGKFSLATSAYTKGRGQTMFSNFVLWWKKIFAKGGPWPNAPLNTPLPPCHSTMPFYHCAQSFSIPSCAFKLFAILLFATVPLATVVPFVTLPFSKTNFKDHTQFPLLSD